MALLEDPERARRLGDAARQSAQGSRWSVQARRNLEIYRTALAGEALPA